MHAQKAACLVLLVFTVGMLYGVNQLRNASTAAKEDAQQKQTEAEQAEQQAQLAQIQLKSLEAKTAPLRQVFKEWEPHFANLSTPQDAERRIAEAVREGDVFLISKKFESREVDPKALISEALVADIVVEDDYTKTLNWLGRLEESTPSCRISRCKLIRGDRGNDIHLELQVQVPVLKKK